MNPVDRLKASACFKRLGRFASCIGLTLLAEIVLLILFFPVLETILISAGMVAAWSIVVAVVIFCIVNEVIWIFFGAHL